MGAEKTVQAERDIHEPFGTDLKRIYADAPIGLCYLDTDLRYIHINEWLAAINGLEAEKHLGRTIGEVLPHVAAGAESQLRHVIENGQALLGGTVEAETAAHPGVSRFYEHNYYPVKSDDGTVVGVSCAVQDITERRLAERDLQEAQAQLETRVQDRTRELEKAQEHLLTLLETTNIIPWEANADTWQFTYVGPQAVKSVVYPTEKWFETDFWPAHIHPDDREDATDFCVRSSSSKDQFEFEYRMLSSDGRIVWIDDRVSVVKEEGKPKTLQGFMIDITQRKRAELLLRDLGGRLITSQEDERRRIARELHDDFSQRLSLLSIELERASQQPPESPARMRELMQDLSNRTKELSTVVHRLSHQLHPAKLEHLGLVAAVKSFCKEVSEQEGIRIEFTHREVPTSIPEDVALCLYRIVQEALRNVVRHSGAGDARVELTGGRDAIRLQVSDPGVGFEPDSVKSNEGLGLVSMRERLRLVGGEFSIQSQPSRGTRIDIGVPLGATAS